MNRSASQQRTVEPVEERDTQILLEFADEASEQLERIEEALLGFEQNPKADGQLAIAARGLHSLKGAAGYVSLLGLQELCHESEDLIGTLPSSTPDGRRRHLDLALDAVAVMRDVLWDVRHSCATQAELPPSPSASALLQRMRQAMTSRTA